MPIPRLVSPSDAPHCALCGNETAKEYTPPAQSFAASHGWTSHVWACASCAMRLKLAAHWVTATVRLPLPR
jgi:hypothetical protein